MERRDLESSFRRKLGLSFDEGGNHRLYYVSNGEQDITRTQVPRGNKYRTIDNKLLGEIAKQLYLKLSELKAAVDCLMTKEDFHVNVIERWTEKYEE